MFSSLGSGYLLLWVYNLLKSLDHSREYFHYFVLVLLVLVREGLVVVVLGFGKKKKKSCNRGLSKHTSSYYNITSRNICNVVGLST